MWQCSHFLADIFHVYSAYDKTFPFLSVFAVYCVIIDRRCEILKCFTFTRESLSVSICVHQHFALGTLKQVECIGELNAVSSDNRKKKSKEKLYKSRFINYRSRTCSVRPIWWWQRYFLVTSSTMRTRALTWPKTSAIF